MRVRFTIYIVLDTGFRRAIRFCCFLPSTRCSHVTPRGLSTRAFVDTQMVLQKVRARTGPIVISTNIVALACGLQMAGITKEFSSTSDRSSGTEVLVAESKESDEEHHESAEGEAEESESESDDSLVEEESVNSGDQVSRRKRRLFNDIRTTDYVYAKNHYGKDPSMSIEKFYKEQHNNLPINVFAVWGQKGTKNDQFNAPSGIACSDWVQKQVSRSTAAQKDNIVCHFAVADTNNHRVTSFKMTCRESKIPWQAIYHRRNKAGDNEMLVSMPNDRKKRARAMIGLDAHAVDEAAQAKVMSAYKKKNRGATKDELHDILTEIRNKERNLVMDCVEKAKNMNHEIWIRMEHVTDTDRVLRANGAPFRRVLGADGPRNAVPFEYYRAKALSLDRKNGTVTVRFAKLIKVSYDGTVGVGHQTQIARQSDGLSTDSNAGGNQDMSIFDVLEAQDKYTAACSEIEQSRAGVSTRGARKGLFQFPKACYFSTHSTLLVTDNDLSQVGSPRLQSFRVTDLQATFAADNVTVCGAAELAHSAAKSTPLTSSFVTLRNPDLTPLSRPMPAFIEVSARVEVNGPDVERLSRSFEADGDDHEDALTDDAAIETETEGTAILCLRGLVVRWRRADASSSKGGDSLSEQAEQHEGGDVAPVDPYQYVFHFDKTGTMASPNVISRYRQKQTVPRHHIKTMLVQCCYRYTRDKTAVTPAATPSNRHDEAPKSSEPVREELLSPWYWGELLGLDADTGKYVVTMPHNVDEAQRALLLNECPTSICDYPLVDHAHIRTDAPVPKPVFQIPHGVGGNVSHSMSKNSKLVFVVDRGHHCIHALELGTGNGPKKSRSHQVAGDQHVGKYLYSIGCFGSERGQLIEPHGMCVHGNRILVADTGNNRVQCFRIMSRSRGGKSDRASVTSIIHDGGFWFTESVYPDPDAVDGQWAHSHPESTSKKARHLITGHASKLDNSFMSNGDYNNLLMAPEDVAVDALGLVVVADTGHHCIRIFGFEEELLETEMKKVKQSELMSEHDFHMVPEHQRWMYTQYTGTKYKGAEGKKQRRYFRSTPRVRLVLLATWGYGCGVEAGFFRYPRSVACFSWLVPSSADYTFDPKKVSTLMQAMAILDSGNNRVQLIQYYFGEKEEHRTVAENVIQGGEFKPPSSGCIVV